MSTAYNDPVFWMLVEIPGCGKSTFAAYLRAEYLSEAAAYICPDVLRAELTGEANDQSRNASIFTHHIPALVAKAAAEGRDVLYDATNVTRKNRRGILEQAKSLGYPITVFVLMDSFNPALCIARNAMREKRVPDDVIHRMHAKLAIPTLESDPEIGCIHEVISHPGDDGSIGFQFD